MNKASRVRADDERRHGHGEGTIAQRTDATGSVRFQAQILVQGRRLTRTFATKDEARQWIRRTVADAGDGLLPADAGKITVGDYLDHWLIVKKTTLKPSTYAVYHFAVHDHIKPKLGKVALRLLRPDHLEGYYAAKLANGAKRASGKRGAETAMTDSGLAPRTVLIHHRLIHKALKDALKKNLVPRNVADAASPPKARRAEMRVWSPEQSLGFLKATSGDRLHAAYTLMLYCGLRAGELVGLRWDDVDLDTSRLQIQRTVQRVRGEKGLVVGEPKSASSRRSIVLSLPAAAGLRHWRVRQKEERAFAGDKWRESGYLFASSIGTVMEPRNLTRSFNAAVKVAALPSIRVHDLRHTCATLLLSRGVHPKIVQEMLGHSQISLTLDTYSHVLPSMQEEAARTMESILGAAALDVAV